MSRREDWLEQRRKLVTASDAAAILGLDDWRSPFEVYAEKVEGYVRERTGAMRRGVRHEAAIALDYADETGREVYGRDPYEIAIHPEHRWLGATLDRTCAGNDEHPAPREGPGALELKMVNAANAPEWREEPPTGYQIQNQIQMACAGLAWGSVAGLIGGAALRWYDATPNPGFLAVAIPQLRAFWERLEAREPPEVDASKATARALASLYADDDGSTVPLEAAALEMWSEKARLGEEIAALEERRQQIDNTLRAQMGACSFGRLPDGSYLTLKSTHRDGYTVQPTKFRQLKRWFPKVRTR